MAGRYDDFAGFSRRDARYDRPDELREHSVNRLQAKHALTLAAAGELRFADLLRKSVFGQLRRAPGLADAELAHAAGAAGGGGGVLGGGGGLRRRLASGEANQIVRLVFAAPEAPAALVARDLALFGNLVELSAWAARVHLGRSLIHT